MASLFRDLSAPSRFADYRASKPDTKKVRAKIDSDVAVFLSNGGEIEKVKTGVSGREPTSQAFVINYAEDKRVKR